MELIFKIIAVQIIPVIATSPEVDYDNTISVIYENNNIFSSPNAIIIIAIFIAVFLLRIRAIFEDDISE